MLHRFLVALGFRLPSPRRRFRDRLLVGMLAVALIPLAIFAVVVSTDLHGVSNDTIAGTQRTILHDQEQRETGLVGDRARLIDQELATIATRLRDVRDQAQTLLAAAVPNVDLVSFNVYKGVYYAEAPAGSTTLLSQTSPAVLRGALDGHHHAAVIASSSAPLVASMQQLVSDHRRIVLGTWIVDRAEQVIRTVPALPVREALDHGQINPDQPLGPRADSIFSTAQGAAVHGSRPNWSVPSAVPQVSWTEPYPTQVTGQLGVTAWQQLADGHTLVGVDISVDALTATLLNPSISGEPQAYPLLVSGGNTVLGAGDGMAADFGYSDSKVVGSQLPLTSSQGFAGGLRDVEANGRSQTLRTTLAGVERQIFTATIPTARWVLATSIPLSDLQPDVAGLTEGIQAGIARILGRLIPVAAILCVLAFIAATVLSRRLVFRMGAVSAAAQRLGAGEMESEVPAVGEDEVGLLGQSLERMRREVNASREAILAASRELEIRVGERTLTLRERNRELVALNQLAGSLPHSLDPGTILDGVLRTIEALVPLRSAAGFLGRELVGEPARRVGMNPSPDETQSIAAAARRAITEERSITAECDDAAVVGLPMATADEVLGALVVLIEGKTPTPRVLALLQAVANQAALALRTAQLSAEGRELAVLEERTRLAREIHDTLAQQLTAIILQLEAAEAFVPRDEKRATDTVVVARDLARSALEEARRSVWNLRPQQLEGVGLVAALGGEIRQWSSRTGIAVDLRAPRARHPLPVSAEAEVTVLRTVQEALGNIGRHSGAHRVIVRMQLRRDELEVSVGDDGVGFDPSQEGGQDSFGLVGMGERARLAGGSLRVESRPGSGTRVILRLPIAETATAAERASAVSTNGRPKKGAA